MRCGAQVQGRWVFDCRAEPDLGILRSESVTLCGLRVTASGFPWQELDRSTTR